VLFKFRGSYAFDSPRNFDISPDGTRFLMIKEAPKAVAALDAKARSELVLVFNWLEELKQRAPAVNPTR
jgi:hypothetical protein